MLEIIKGLLKDDRLRYVDCPEGCGQVRGRLLYMLEHKDQITNEQIAYVNYIREHIKNIHPHIQNMIVNGDWAPVELVTDNNA